MLKSCFDRIDSKIFKNIQEFIENILDLLIRSDFLPVFMVFMVGIKQVCESVKRDLFGLTNNFICGSQIVIIHNFRLSIPRSLIGRSNKIL